MSDISFHSTRRVSKKSAGGKRAFVPRLEALESRDLLSTFTVINTASDPSTSGSLPWAVQQANSTPGTNTIDFNIPGSGTHIININSTLSVTNQMVIDGTSQPGYNGTPLISVQGSASVPTLFDLGSGSSGSTIQGLDMYDYTANAVSLTSATKGNWIQNNWIGFYRDPSTGKVFLNNNLGDQFNNNSSGIDLLSNNNAIRNNVISGSDTGILFEPNRGARGLNTGNSISANFIGTDPSGTTAAGYGNVAGIVVDDGCRGNSIGGDNVISGNATEGIDINGGDHNLIFGNKIGTDVNGNYAIPNGTGITLNFYASGNLIGPPLMSGNLISGNLNQAISIADPIIYGGSDNNQILNNIIGLNASQTAVIGNGAYGIFIQNNSQGNLIQSNVIAGARVSGVVLSSAATNNAVNQNWIGLSSSGQSFPNGNYGVEVLSSSNSVLQNSFGPNGIGSVFVGPGTNGNLIGYTPQPTLSSFMAQIQSILDNFSLMVQAVEKSDPSGLFAALQGYVYFVVVVETELLSLQQM